MAKKVVAYVGAASLGNPGPAAAVAGLRYDDEQGRTHKKVANQLAAKASYNRACLVAAVLALTELKFACEVELHTESKYLVKLLEGGKSKANSDLVDLLKVELERHDVKAVYATREDSAGVRYVRECAVANAEEVRQKVGYSRKSYRK